MNVFSSYSLLSGNVVWIGLTLLRLPPSSIFMELDGGRDFEIACKVVNP